MVMVLMISVASNGAELKFKRFRLGRILNAEITTKPQAFSELNEAAYPQKYRKKAFAAITVQLDPKRSLSKYDFVLKADGKEYPCVGVRKDNGVEKWKFENTDPQSLYTMYFMVEGAGSPTDFDLVYKLATRGPQKVSLSFKNIGSREFTPAKQVPRQGML